MVQRIRDGAGAASKKLTQKKFSAEFSYLETVLSYYNTKLCGLVSSLLDNLYPGANTPRRSSVLEILTAVNNIIGLSSAQTGLDLRPTVSQHSANSLLECLHDSYEANKERALGILLSLPASVLEHDNPSLVSVRLEEMMALMLSSKPASTVTATYLVRLLLDCGASRDSQSLMRAAARGGKDQVVFWILDTDTQDQDHLSSLALVTGALHGHTEVRTGSISLT